MPTKTDRILSYLPRTFQTSPRPPVLYPVADAFGNELLQAENSLAAVMLAHWVDFADKNAAEINDLAQIASLYGLAPRRDPDGEILESVEEFREHLKRYIRTFLEGTVTVQGILRVTAEALFVRIADETEQLDRWWTRAREEELTIESRGDDAAVLLRFDRGIATGSPARPAQVKGTVDLAGGIDLEAASILRLKVDDVNLGEINLAEGAAPSTPVTLEHIVQIINKPPRPTIARHDGHNLTLSSPTIGPAGKLEVLGGPNDAAAGVLGLVPRSFHGGPPTGAQLVGATDLNQPVDLSSERFLRIEIDGNLLADFDCAGPNAAQTTLSQIRAAINTALGINVATDDGKHLIINSPSKGFQSTISLQPPAAQSAAQRLFGVATAFQTGRDAARARATSRRDLRGGVDLSERSFIRLRFDGGAPITINCAGADPKKTQRIEIVSAINDAVNAPVAEVTGTALSITSTTSGPASRIDFETAAGGDAASDIFGIGSLAFSGSPPSRARLTGTPVLTGAGGVDLRARNILSLAVDGAAPSEINLTLAASTVDELESAPLEKVAGTINTAFGGALIASTDGERLLLASPREGGASALEVVPLRSERLRRFVTKAIVTDEAAPAVFGFSSASARGTTASTARMIGSPDLSLSSDLKDERFLRLIVDGNPAVEIDCAGPRPRATTLVEIVEKINAALEKAKLPDTVATHDGKHLVLLSPSSGSESRIAIEPPRVALETLLGIEPLEARGEDAQQVRFTSTVDLKAGIDLNPQAALKLGFDGAPPIEISLAGPAPNHQSPFEIASTINAALKGAFAATDGRRITLSSAKKGPESKIVFAAPPAHDVTKDIFGVTPPRAYQGDPAKPAKVEGLRDLSGANDLSVFRFLQLSVDAGPVATIDCASKASNPKAATLSEIVQSIGPAIASVSADGKHLVLKSQNTGATAQLSIEAHTPGDARNRLLGDAQDAAGTPPGPAVIVGTRDLLGAIDLRRRSLLRVAIDGGQPIDIEVAGQVPGNTAADEIVAKINAVVPGLAALTDEDHLKLTSPTAGEASSLSLLPLRYLEVVEYNSQPATAVDPAVKHRSTIDVGNGGASDVVAEVTITAPQGTVGPALVNESLGWMVRLFVVVEVGSSVRLYRDERFGLRAEIVSANGETRPVPASRILVGPLGAQAWVPFAGIWELTNKTDDAPTLQLNNPLARSILRLRAKDPSDDVSVRVTESDLSKLAPSENAPDGEQARLAGKVRVEKAQFYLVDGTGNKITELMPGPNALLTQFENFVVTVSGPLYENPAVMVVQEIARLFDVVLQSSLPTFAPVEERYAGVTIGAGTYDANALITQINAGTKSSGNPSTIVHAEELDKALVLRVPRGKTIFRYLDCHGARFNQARFDQSYFPNGICGERGIFDVSRFTDVPPEQVKAVFASSDPSKDPPVKVQFRWVEFKAGTFSVNLPADLPARFGGRFNEARFGQAKDNPELYAGAVAEPPDDPKFVTKLIGDGVSNLLKAAAVVGSVPLGWAPVRMPFRKPQKLTLGKPGQSARLYLEEEGLVGFIQLEAREEGAWGNQIAVAARQTGPAIYDISVIFLGDRFENARFAVLGEPAGELTQALAKPGPVGVLQAKAAGIRAAVTRDRAEYDQLTTTQ